MEYNCSIVSVYDGKKLGRILDIIFDNSNGAVKGIVVPGDKKLFRRGDDIFVPLGNIRRIGDDVILVSLQARGNMMYYEGRAQREGYHEVGNAYSNFAYSQPSKKRHETSYAAYRQDEAIPASSRQNSYVRYRPLSTEKYK